MKIKLTKKFTTRENPYYKFSKNKNYNKTMNFTYNFQDSFNNDNSFNKTTQNNRLINNFKNNSVIHSASKSLKTVALNSKLYSNYIDFYPILKNKKFISIKMQSLLIMDSNEEKISFPNEPTNSIFLSYIKEIKPMKKIIFKKPYGFKYDNTKIRFDRLKTDGPFTAEINILGDYVKKIYMKAN